MVFGAVLAAALAAPRQVAAEEPPTEAEKLIRQGVQLRKENDDEAAARLFQKAYDQAHSPRAAGQLGLAEQALGRWEDAARHVREAIEARDDPWVAKNHAALADALGTIGQHLGRIEVNGDPEGAEVSINGRAVGKLPLAEAVEVSAGQVDVELRAPGYQPAQRTVTIVPGQYQRMVFRLAKEAAAKEPVAKESAASVASVEHLKVEAEPHATGGQIVAPPSGDATQPSEGPSRARTAAKWTAAGLAAAGLTAGVTFALLHSKNVSAFQSADGGKCAVSGDQGVMQGTGEPVPECQSALDAYSLDRTMEIVGFVSAGVFAATWLVLQLTEGPSPRAGTDHAMGNSLCVPSLSGLGLSCAFRF